MVQKALLGPLGCYVTYENFQILFQSFSFDPLILAMKLEYGTDYISKDHNQKDQYSE
jgi:hypothetical protein